MFELFVRSYLKRYYPAGDNLANSGATLEEVNRHLKEKFSHVTEVKSAVIWLKGCSAIRPDYFLDERPAAMHKNGGAIARFSAVLHWDAGSAVTAVRRAPHEPVIVARHLLLATGLFVLQCCSAPICEPAP